MLGGTGLRWSGAAASGLKQRLSTQQRSISSFKQTQRAFRPNTFAQTTPVWKRTRHTPLLRAATFARFNSNATAATVTPSIASTTQSPLDNTVASSIQAPPDTLLAEIPEHIGYLKEMGLDFGWGPSSMTQWLFEHVHIYTGLPWWVSIAISAALVRAVLWKPTKDASDMGARMKALQPVMKPLNADMAQARETKDVAAIQKIRTTMNKIRSEAGVSVPKTMGGMLMLPVAFASFRVLRGMADLPVPAIEFEKFLWIENMAMADPTYIVPALTAAVTAMTIRTAVKTNGPNHFMSNPLVVTGLPLLTFFFTWHWAAFMQIYFLFSGLLGLIQNRLLASPTFRASTGLYPHPILKAEDPIPLVNPITPQEQRYLEKISLIDKAIWHARRYADGHKRKFVVQMRQTMNMEPESTPVAAETQKQGGGKARMTKAQLERANEYEQRRRAEQKATRKRGNRG